MITAKRAVEILGYLKLGAGAGELEILQLQKEIGKCRECIDGMIIGEINQGPGFKPVRRKDGAMLYGYRCKTCLGTGVANGICETCFASYDVPAFPREPLLHQNDAIANAHKKTCESCYELYASKFSMLRPMVEVKQIQAKEKEDKKGKKG